MAATSHGVLQAENEVLALVKRWVDTYLVRAERRNDIEPRDGEPQGRRFRRPVEWQVDKELWKLDEKKLPLILVVSTGFPRGLEDTAGTGDLDGFMVMGVAVYAKDSTRDASRVIARVYGEAIAELLDHKQTDLPDWLTIATRPADTYDENWRRPSGSEPAQKIGDIAYISFVAHAAAVRDRHEIGPADPYDPDADPPTDPDAPIVETVQVTVESL